MSSHAKRPRASDTDGGTSSGSVKRPKRKQKQTSFKTNPTVVLKKIKVKHADINGDIDLELSNEYETLSENESEIDVAHSRRRNDKNRKKKESTNPRLPPIVVPPPCTKAQLVQALDSLQLQNYHIKITSTGTYVFVDNASDHSSIKDLLKKNNVGHFSHDLPTDKVAKVMLKGLDRMNPDDIKKELIDQGFPAVDVKMIIPRNARYSDHTNYLLYFSKKTMDFKSLYAVKSLFHTIVHWEPYRPLRTAPTQCRRCFMYGHGTRHCQMPYKCQFCDKTHEPNKCPAVKAAYDATYKDELADDNVPEDAMETETRTGPAKSTEEKQAKILRNLIPTCCLCGGKHLATDPQCTARKKYLEIQRNIQARNRSAHQSSQAGSRSNTTSSSPAARTGQLQQRAPITNPVPGSSKMTFRDAVLHHHSQAASVPDRNNEGSTPGGECSDNLFTYQEINSLLQELMSGLRKCRDKYEQFKVISELAFKYVGIHG